MPSSKGEVGANIMNASRLILSFGLFALVSCGIELPPEIKKSLQKTTNYIEQFRSEHSRLPDREDYINWQRTNDLRGVVDYGFAQGNTNNYIIYIWLGEKMVHYSSATHALNTPK